MKILLSVFFIDSKSSRCSGTIKCSVEVMFFKNNCHLMIAAQLFSISKTNPSKTRSQPSQNTDLRKFESALQLSQFQLSRNSLVPAPRVPTPVMPVSVIPKFTCPSATRPNASYPKLSYPEFTCPSFYNF
jgi:hypothetical protein